MDLIPNNASDSLCRPCCVAAPPFEKAIAWGVYRENLRALLHLLKYDRMERVADRLGALLAAEILAVPGWPEDLLAVVVPLHAARRRQRGFNQAELLARAALRILRQRRPELRVRFAAGVLERQRSTESQAGLSPHQRRVNVRGAFFVRQPEAVAGRNVLLIDDIYTTGATARACSQVLRRAGASSVWVATVARAQKEDRTRTFSDPRTADEIAAEDQTAPEVPMEEDVAFWEEGRAALTAGSAR